MLPSLHLFLVRFITLLILATTLSVYAPSLCHDFIYNWDDDEYVTENPVIRGFTADHVATALTSSYVGNYAPLHIVSHMADYSLWGLNAGGFIFGNILLHGLNGLLLYLLVLRVHGNRILGLISSFIFLFHPAQVESVVWVSQRKTVLALFFFLGSLHLYLKYRDRKEGRRWYYTGSVTSFCLALLSKSVTVILPLALVCYDLLFPAPGTKFRIRDKLPFFFAALLVGGIGLITQDRSHGGGRTPYPGGTPYATLCTMLPVFCRYLGILLWPEKLSIVYSPPVYTTMSGTVLASAAVLLFAGLFGWSLWRRRSPLFFWFALFVIGFLPVSQLVPLITLMNDRYLYFPMVGAATIAAWFPARILAGDKTRLRAACWVVIGVLGTVMVWQNIQRQAVWHDEVTLWQDAVSKVPGNITARNNLSEALLERGDRSWDEGNLVRAGEFYERVLVVDPGDQIALHNLGAVHIRRGEYTRALPHLLKLTTLYPWYESGFLRLGTVWINLGKEKEAVAAYGRALQINGSSPEAHEALEALRKGRQQGTVTARQSVPPRR